ncbi:MAG TPA: HD domain-containing phosphohydrolase [Solirubrobacteraceae bacterium]|nr:HD domain-containing phosphohydrolase [Solirubrobacteraceae bacterium]
MAKVARSLADAEEEIAALLAELEHQRSENEIKEQQLDRYAAELRATSRRERQRTRELAGSYMTTVRALAGAVEARDAYTAHHADRVTAYGIELAATTGLEELEDTLLECAFLLHDIGKVAIPDGILFKAGTLDAQEREVMQRHPLIGEEIIGEIPFLEPTRPLIRHHHERWDGGGYPDGLAGEEIPPVARVFALADALDALTSDRPYRAAVGVAQAREVIESSDGHFDPAVLEAFASISDERIEEIRSQLS